MDSVDGKKIIEKIKENYKNMNKIICGELNLVSTHGGLMGHSREEFWIGLIEKMIPKKFSIEKGVIIIDSFGNCSNEVDIAVIDNQYTPYVFNYGNLKFIPIEAVAIVLECKSSKWDKSTLEKWCESIDKLKAQPIGIARMATGYTIGSTITTQKKTSPIKILASMRVNPSQNTLKAIKKCFDFIIYYQENEHKNFELSYEVPNGDKTLFWWGNKLNNGEVNGNDVLEINIEKSDKNNKINYSDFFECAESNEDSLIINSKLNNLSVKDNDLLSFKFQLNQLLMIINNPMPFPHFAYVKMFNDV